MPFVNVPDKGNSYPPVSIPARFTTLHQDKLFALAEEKCRLVRVHDADPTPENRANLIAVQATLLRVLYPAAIVPLKMDSFLAKLGEAFDADA